MSHTPGPWFWDCDPPKAVNRMALVTTSKGSRSIDCTDSGTKYAEDCANAKLIAAAPELLEALKAVLHDEDLVYTGAIYESLDACGFHVSLVNKVRAAIAKAEGK